MGEKLSLELEFLDKITAPAARAASSLRNIESSAAKAQKALSFGDDIMKTMGKLAKIKIDPTGYKMMVKAQDDLRKAQKKLQEEAIGKQPHGIASGMSKMFNEKLGLSSLASAHAIGEVLGEGAFKLGETLLEAAHKFVDIIADGFKEALREAGKEEKTRLGYKYSLGGAAGESQIKDIERFAKMTQFTEDQIKPMLIGLRRAGFSQKGARSAFAAAADVEAGSLGTTSAGSVLDMMKSIRLKEGVRAKQLPALGINVPEFFKDLGKKLGVSPEAAAKRAEKAGGVDATLLINSIEDAIEKRQNAPLGAVAGAASQTLPAKLEKLKALPGEFFEKLVDSGGYVKLSESLGKLLEKLDPETPTGKRISAALERMFNQIIGWVDELSTDEGLDKLVQTFEDVVHFLERCIELVGNLVGIWKSIALPSFEDAAVTGGFFDKIKKASGYNANAPSLMASDSERARAMVANMTAKEQGEAYARLLSMPAAETADGSSKNVAQSNKIDVHVTANKGDDANHTGQVVGRHVARHTSDGLERAAQEGGL